MDFEWNDSQPIYRQLRDRVVAMMLDGVLKEGDPLPSVRTVAAQYRVNPLTVLKAYQQLVDEELVETKRGRGMYINAGAHTLLLRGERQKFLEAPHIVVARLDFAAADGLGDGVVVVIDFERAEILGAEIDRADGIRLAAEPTLQAANER